MCGLLRQRMYGLALILSVDLFIGISLKGINNMFKTFNKYSNKKTTVDGITFASKKEANRYSELVLMEKAKIISNLMLQVSFPLQSSFIDSMGNYHREIKYIADFTYFDRDGKYHIEDCKGMRTEVYKIKKKLFLFITKSRDYIFSEV